MLKNAPNQHLILQEYNHPHYKYKFAKFLHLFIQEYSSIFVEIANYHIDSIKYQINSHESPF